MFNQATLALLLATSLLTTAAAAAENESPRMYSSERPIETNTAGLPLPRAVPGSMTLRPCGTCQLVTLELTAASQFFINRKPATFAELHALALSSSANVVVFYDSTTNVVTRIALSEAR
jgi:hypothetical protein